jgi:hypothetical protein
MSDQTVTPTRNTIELPPGFILLTVQFSNGYEHPIRLQISHIISYLKDADRPYDLKDVRTIVTCLGRDEYYVKETPDQIDYAILRAIFKDRYKS